MGTVGPFLSTGIKITVFRQPTVFFNSEGALGPSLTFLYI